MYRIFLVASAIWMCCWALSIPLIVPADSDLGAKEARFRHDFAVLAMLSLGGAFVSLDLGYARHWRILAMLLLAIICSLIPFRAATPYAARGAMIALFVATAAGLHLFWHTSSLLAIRLCALLVTTLVSVTSDYVTRAQLGLLSVPVHNPSFAIPRSVSLRCPSPGNLISVTISQARSNLNQHFIVEMDEQTVLDTEIPNEMIIGCVQISADGTTLVVALNGRTYTGSSVQVWTLERRGGVSIFAKTKENNSIDHWVYSVDTTQGGKMVAFSDKRGMHLWKPGGSDLDINSIASNERITTVRFSPDGKCIAGCKLGLLQLWDADLNLKQSISLKESQPESIAFSRDRNRIFGFIQTPDGLFIRAWRIIPNMKILLPIWFAACATWIWIIRLRPDGHDSLCGYRAESNSK